MTEANIPKLAAAAAAAELEREMKGHLPMYHAKRNAGCDVSATELIMGALSQGAEALLEQDRQAREMKVVITESQLADLKKDWFERGFNGCADACANVDAEPDDRIKVNFAHPDFVRDRARAFARELAKR